MDSDDTKTSKPDTISQSDFEKHLEDVSREETPERLRSLAQELMRILSLKQKR